MNPVREFASRRNSYFMASLLVEKFVDSALAQLRRRGLMLSPGQLPERMRDSSIPPLNDWIGWREVPSVVTDAELNALEQETGLMYPLIYRDFLKYRHFVELSEIGIGFEKHLCNDWQATLRKAYFRSWPRKQILDIGLLPFGRETNLESGPVCFDTRKRDVDGDCPVVFWDHEWVGGEKEIQPLFSSCRKMFDCLSFATTTDVNFIHHFPDDDPTQLILKSRLLGNFLALDPEGAGGPGRAYWTCWGVDPAA